MNAHDLAQRLNLKRLARSWRGRCPACDYPGTFAVREGREGRVLFSCASCHDRDALAEAVTLATGQEHRPEPRDTENEAAARQRKAAFALRLWNGSEAAPGTLAVTAIYDLLRSQRNDLGHPRDLPPTVEREEVFANLQIFPRFYETAEQLRTYLSANPV